MQLIPIGSSRRLTQDPSSATKGLIPHSVGSPEGFSRFPATHLTSRQREWPTLPPHTDLVMTLHLRLAGWPRRQARPAISATGHPD
jgi:hypothetical protein